MFASKVVQRKAGRTYAYWVLKETLWDGTERRSSQRYLASIGPRLTISLERARVTVEDLRKVRRLRIVDGEGAA